jgi:hypothetical protein
MVLHNMIIKNEHEDQVEGVELIIDIQFNWRLSFEMFRQGTKEIKKENYILDFTMIWLNTYELSHFELTQMKLLMWRWKRIPKHLYTCTKITRIKNIKGDETNEECDRGCNSNSCKSNHQHGNYNNMPTLISFQCFFCFYLVFTFKNTLINLQNGLCNCQYLSTLMCFHL